MPINTGRRPPLERVDILLRNGMVVRNVDPHQWRWKPWPEGPSGGDIEKYQKSTE
jgi:hypothetical protein